MSQEIRKQQKARSKKKKEPFWKKGPPELQHIATHIGHMMDNMKANDAAELILLGAFAVLGYKAWGPYGIASGPLAYKLSTTMGGTPPVSQIAGLLMLMEMGLSIADWNLLPSDVKRAIAEIQGSKPVEGPALGIPGAYNIASSLG